MIIETSNLIIEPISEKGLKYILKNIDDSCNIPIPKNASIYQIKKFIEFNNKIVCFNSIGYLYIRLKNNLDIVGLISIIPRYINQSLINELGYMTIEKYRKNGIMKEALYYTLKFIFNSTDIMELYSLIDKNNMISKHILENKMRFNFKGTFMDTNSFKDVYYLNKNVFLNMK